MSLKKVVAIFYFLVLFITYDLGFGNYLLSRYFWEVGETLKGDKSETLMGENIAGDLKSNVLKLLLVGPLSTLNSFGIDISIVFLDLYSPKSLGFPPFLTSIISYRVALKSITLSLVTLNLFLFITFSFGNSSKEIVVL